MKSIGGARIFNQDDINRIMLALEYTDPAYELAYRALRIALGIESLCEPDRCCTIDGEHYRSTVDVYR